MSDNISLIDVPYFFSKTYPNDSVLAIGCIAIEWHSLSTVKYPDEYRLGSYKGVSASTKISYVRIAGLLLGEFTGHRWIPFKYGQ